MFQLGSLIVLCGLLSCGTSALLSDVLQSLNLDIASLQETLNLQSVKDNILGALKTLNLDSINFLTSGLRLNINELNILDVQASSSSDGNTINFQMPVKVNVSVFLPLIGSTVDVAVSLDVINSLTVQTDAQTGLPTVAVGQCSSDTDNISISLLGRQSTLINRLLDDVSGLLTNIVSGLLQNQICPLLQTLLGSLNVDIVQNILSTLTGQLPVSI